MSTEFEDDHIIRRESEALYAERRAVLNFLEGQLVPNTHTKNIAFFNICLSAIIDDIRTGKHIK